ncbi:AGE family epimerase/isomerase [Phenylobacterium sp.]|uniref:AGE family epimerase/isomerase n=1 Tax=Phenylobacterium sp. TaxID=1871053 RepID=UPI002C57B08F|nr:AGE family epimerase/isomerase [Phenylobacterium sp.]HVI33721.1 AGE family epimerase/isomerase [Phenylobacterium sp.]
MAPDFRSLSDAARWYGEWLRDAALPLWSTEGLDAARGSFQETLTVDGAPAGPVRRSRVQTRQVWVFATAAGEGWGRAYGEIACRAFDFHRAHYLRPDGLFARAADAEGRITDPTPLLYEQAFALLALSGLHAAGLGDRRAEAGALLEAVEALRHPCGGWREAGERPFQANAHMHLLEAALAWEAAGEGRWAAVSDEIATLALERFIQDGLLREFFDEAWRPLGDRDGGLVEPGHQFEWAWLLDQWATRRSRTDLRSVVQGLFERGLQGVDPGRGVVVGSVWPDMSVRDPVGRLWAQTEHLRAAVAFGTEAQALAAAAGLAKFLHTPRVGTWRDKMQADGSFVDEPAPATSLYHLVAGLMPLLAPGRARDG